MECQSGGGSPKLVRIMIPQQGYVKGVGDRVGDRGVKEFRFLTGIEENGSSDS